MRKLLTLTRRMPWSQRQEGRKSFTKVALAGVLGVAMFGALGVGAATAAPAAGSCSGPSVTSKPSRHGIRPVRGQATARLPVHAEELQGHDRADPQLRSHHPVDHRAGQERQPGRRDPRLQDAERLRDDGQPAPPNPGGPYFGEIVGRYGNRIAKGTFQLGGHTYTLPINNGVNGLHGGFVGFGNHVWASRAVHAGGAAGVALTIVSPNGDGGANVGCVVNGQTCTGYPGKLTLTVTYLLDDSARLWIHYHATVAGPATVLNPTNHAYFNMAGEASGDTYGQEVMINAGKYTPTDSTQIPTGVEAPVAGTPSTSAPSTPSVADQRRRPAAADRPGLRPQLGAQQHRPAPVHPVRLADPGRAGAGPGQRP